MKGAITLPTWLHWLLPRRLFRELEERVEITGRASTGKEYLGGGISWKVTVEKPDETPK